MVAPGPLVLHHAHPKAVVVEQKEGVVALAVSAVRIAERRACGRRQSVALFVDKLSAF